MGEGLVAGNEDGEPQQDGNEEVAPLRQITLCGRNAEENKGDEANSHQHDHEDVSKLQQEQEPERNLGWGREHVGPVLIEELLGVGLG